MIRYLQSTLIAAKYLLRRLLYVDFFFSSRRRHTRYWRDWSSDVCSSDLVRDTLLRLEGVGDLIIFGERQYSLRIWLDPEKLASYGMTSSEVVRAIQEQNVQVSGGALGQEPTPTDAAFQLTVTTQGRFEDPRQFRQIIVQARDGRLVRLQDVARIELGAQDYVTNSYLNGKPAVALAIFQRPGTNADRKSVV